MTAPADPRQDLWPRLLHRWFIEYNPTPLVSAAFVLGGVWLVSRAAALDASVVGQLGVAGIAEVYSLALIGAAAFLFRIELRRPAVMLALLAVLYQADLTMHVETSAYLGALGVAASGAWLVLFALKLRLLAWALELRLSRSALVVPLLGALGMAAIPHLLREVGRAEGASITTLWLFALGTVALHTSREVRSRIGFDVRGRRALRATWLLWGAMATGHALYWAHEHALALAVVPCALLLATRWVRREPLVWLLVGGTLLGVGLSSPALFSVTALMAAATLVARIFRTPARREEEAEVRSHEPYRSSEAPAATPRSWTVFVRADEHATARLAAGALLTAWLSAWTAGWTGTSGPHLAGLPLHQPVLDLALLAVGVALVWRLRRLVTLAPLAFAALHLGVQTRHLTLPVGALQWGLTSIAIGFTLLLASVYGSWYARRRMDPLEPEEPPMSV